VAHVLRADGEQVEGMEGVSDCFTIEQEVAWVFRCTAGNRLGNRSGESQAVDAGDLVTVFLMSRRRPSSFSCIQ
jgi:hypothetical protein